MSPEPRRGRVIFLHLASTNTAALQNVRIVRVLHLVNIPDVLVFAHFTLGGGFTKILKSDACPAFLGNTLLRPFPKR